jgi:hypothetical protein
MAKRAFRATSQQGWRIPFTLSRRNGLWAMWNFRVGRRGTALDAEAGGVHEETCGGFHWLNEENRWTWDLTMKHAGFHPKNKMDRGKFTMKTWGFNWFNHENLWILLDFAMKSWNEEKWRDLVTAGYCIVSG